MHFRLYALVMFRSLCEITVTATEIADWQRYVYQNYFLDFFHDFKMGSDKLRYSFWDCVLSDILRRWQWKMCVSSPQHLRLHTNLPFATVSLWPVYSSLFRPYIVNFRSQAHKSCRDSYRKRIIGLGLARILFIFILNYDGPKHNACNKNKRNSANIG